MIKDDYLEILAALNNTLYISKYIINKGKKYKKDKKRIEKMLEDTENGKFVEYLKDPLEEELEYEDD